jgi:uncharacterized protein (TIGR02246 family)
MKKTGLAIVFVSILAAAELAAAPSSGDPRLDLAIEKANSEWGVAMKAGEAAPIAAPYLEDAVFVGPDGSCTRGKAAIETMYRDRFSKRGKALSTRIEPHRVSVDGALAYEWGYGEVTSLADGRPAKRGGPYLTVWARQPDGDWKILRNVVLP